MPTIPTPRPPLEPLGALDLRITRWMAAHGVDLLRWSLGIVFLWFGVLKFFPGLSPAQELAARTIEKLTAGFVGPSIALPVLAAWECAIGIGLLLLKRGVALRAVLFLLFAQMAGTVLPIFFFPHEVFTRIPYAPTLEGQYILKNVVLIAAALVVGATVRGGRLSSEPKA